MSQAEYVAIDSLANNCELMTDGDMGNGDQRGRWR